MPKLLALKSLTSASIKMYFRNRTAVFFTLFIPLILILIFGVINFGGEGSVLVSLTNKSDSPVANGLAEALKEIKIFKIEEVDQTIALDKLNKDKTDLVVVVPENFGRQAGPIIEPVKIEAYYNEANPQSGQTAGLILQQLVNGINNQLTKSPQLLTVELKGVQANKLTYIDFLIPGIVAMSIMQLGVFSVAFGFVSYKTTGALRRLQVTPTKAINFITAQSVARLIIGVIQVAMLVGIGIVFFNLNFVGNIINFLVLATLGVAAFLAFGFGIAGWAKDENQAAPVANLIAFPMMFLSGTFFPRESFPKILQSITEYLPLTYLADGLRQIANEGANLWAVRGDILGLLVWGVVAIFITTKVFRWE